MLHWTQTPIHPSFMPGYSSSAYLPSEDIQDDCYDSTESIEEEEDVGIAATRLLTLNRVHLIERAILEWSVPHQLQGKKITLCLPANFPFMKMITKLACYGRDHRCYREVALRYQDRLVRMDNAIMRCEILAHDDDQSIPLAYAAHVEVLMDLRYFAAGLAKEQKESRPRQRTLKRRKVVAMICPECSALVPSFPCFQCSS